jgi:alkaline phosphatase D
MKKILLFNLLLINYLASAQLISGPMLGYIEHREALIWLEVAPTIRTVEIRFWAQDKPAVKNNIRYTGTLGKSYNPIKLVLEPLEMNTTYEYEVLLDDAPMKIAFPTRFKTKELWEWRKDAPNFNFLFGSCVYINDSIYDRPGKPYGKNPKILETMGNIPTDFMIWDGDNVYLREADFSSAAGISYRYSYNFKTPEMQKLRGTRANYAIWDDHDYGPNDSDGNYELKDYTLKTFKSYWGNKTFGQPDHAGIYSKFKWNDCEFFLMDDRYYRSANNLPDSIGNKPNKNKVFYGKRQLDWLKSSLLSSESVFKFIVTGGQMLNPMADKECFYFYPAEWHELMDFIAENNIDGVIFLTGDRHFSELIRYQPKKGYPLYDFTCSSITSGIHDISKKPEMKNPARVAGSLLLENNFSKISVSGAKKERKVTFETIDIHGKTRWTHSIHQNELKNP